MDAAEGSVRSFRAEVAAAVGRAHRARAEAHRRATDFRATTDQLVEQRGATAEGEQRAAALAHRDRMGLAVPELTAAVPNEGSTADTQDAAEKARRDGELQDRAPSDGSDLDFSQAHIMR